MQKLQHQEDLRRRVLELAEKDLEYRLPQKKAYWAGYKAGEFVNGAKVEMGERNFYYSKKDSRDWRERRHFVEVLMTVKGENGQRVFSLKYVYAESGPWADKVKLEFIYGFPSEEYLYAEDPFGRYRDDQKLMRALRQRKAYVGMPEKALPLALGKPLAVESKTSLYGVEKKLTYRSQAVYIKDGKVSAMEFQ